MMASCEGNMWRRSLYFHIKLVILIRVLRSLFAMVVTWTNIRDWQVRNQDKPFPSTWRRAFHCNCLDKWVLTLYGKFLLKHILRLESLHEIGPWGGTKWKVYVKGATGLQNSDCRVTLRNMSTIILGILRERCTSTKKHNMEYTAAM
jgi:hypothetical protein